MQEPLPTLFQGQAGDFSEATSDGHHALGLRRAMPEALLPSTQMENWGKARRGFRVSAFSQHRRRFALGSAAATAGRRRKATNLGRCRAGCVTVL
jgi:hypothetical protein